MAQAKIITWIKTHPRESFSLLLTLLLAAFLRLYRIRDYLTFLGDEGRDVRVVRDLITQGNLVFIGPQTSVGNMYLGPLYYYMMAPALFLSRFDPVGPAIMVALIGVATVGLIWYITRKYFGFWSASLAAFLYAISPVALIYSRSSWNPNPMPFFALLAVWLGFEAWHLKKTRYFVYSFVFLAASIQMHYLGLLLIPVIGIIWLLSLSQEKFSLKFKKHSVLGIALFLLMMSPLVLFDLKHNYLNLRAILDLVFGRHSAFVSTGHTPGPVSVLKLISTDLLLAKQPFGSSNLLLILPIIFAIVRNWKLHFTKVLSLWVLIGFIGLSFYKNEIYIHYLGFLFPAIFILFGTSISSLLKLKNPLFMIMAISITMAITFFSLINTPFKNEPNRQLWRTEKVADIIVRESKGLPFNFGLIAKNNYDESYRYFLENKKANIVRGEDKVVDQLFVVCENGDSCHPEGDPQWQVAVFGIARIDWFEQVDSIKIYRLVHPTK